MKTFSNFRFLMPVIALFLVYALIIPAAALTNARPATSPQDDKKKKEEKKDDKKDDKKKEDDDDDKDDKAARAEIKYQKFLADGLARYAKDEDFRDEVDLDLQNIEREHAETAYFINTRDGNDKLLIKNGDQVTLQDTLYDNPLAQDYLNRLGQSLVPEGSDKLYAFRITLNPLIEARSMSTGTIYISTGLLSRIENEAQLAFILGHEIGHVEQEHWKQDVLVYREMVRWNRKQEKKRAGISLGVGLLAGGLIGGGTKSATNAVAAGLTAAWVTSMITKLTIRNSNFSWQEFQDKECDQLALRYMLKRKYDVQEAPKVYGLLLGMARKERRVRSGFMGKIERLNARIGYVNALLNDQVKPTVPSISPKDFSAERETNKREKNVGAAIKGALAADIQQKLDAGELIASTAEFSEVMAQIRRDNGVQAFYFDMFQMAKDNLNDAIDIRSNDPYAHYYLGKVLKQTARTPAQRREAMAFFTKAIELDTRKAIAEPHLYKALTIIEMKDKNQWGEAVQSLKTYVTIYQRTRAGALPPNMEVIYSFMQEAGEKDWIALPVMNSKESIAIADGAASTPVSGNSVPQPTATPRKRP